MILEIILVVWYLTMCGAIGGLLGTFFIWVTQNKATSPYVCIYNNDGFLAYLAVFLCPFLNMYVYVGGHDIAHFGKDNIKVN